MFSFKRLGSYHCPMNESKKDILETALVWHEGGLDFCIATVIETWGSAPVPVGSQMLIDKNQHFVGSVSGGCVEGAVVLEAEDILKSGVPKVLSFAVSDDMALQVGLGCGGQIKVFIESFDEDKGEFLKQIVRYQRGRVPCVLVSNLRSGAQRVVGLHDRHKDELAGELETVFSTEKCLLTNGENPYFLHLYHTALKLVIVGAVHIAQSLVPMAKLAGFDVAVIDPRESFASPARFGDVVLIAKWPDETLAEFDLDNRTALVVLSHDAKIDDPALRIGLESECFYIGALGSRKTHAKRLQRLRGLDGLERIDGPIGLDIGAKGANEIAVSIVGKLVAALRRE